MTDTTELPPPDPIAAAVSELTHVVTELRTEMRADMTLLKDEGQRTNLRLTRQEVRMDDVEVRLTANSMRARAESNSDLEQDARIAAEIVARQALANDLADTKKEVAETKKVVDDVKTETSAQTVILQQLLKLTEKPVVKLIATAIGAAVLSWFAARGTPIK